MLKERTRDKWDVGIVQKRQDWDHKVYLMHEVLYIVQLSNEEGDMHIIYITWCICLCDSNLVSSAFYSPSNFCIIQYTCTS